MHQWKLVLLAGLCGVTLAADGKPGMAPMRLPASAIPGPTTRPIVKGRMTPAGRMVAKSVELPSAFAILMTRSIFASNGKPAHGGAAGPLVPEAGMALRGVVFDDARFVAFIEDTARHRTLQLRPGDALCAGNVRQISLDGLSFECHGKLTHIRVGQNLLGAALPPPPQAQTASAVIPAQHPGPRPPATRSAKGPVFGIGPDGQRIREYSQERKPQ